MALDLPDTEQSVIDAALSDVQATIPGSAPFLQNSAMGAITTSMGARIFDFYRVLGLAERQTWWDTATDDELDRWGGILQLSRNASTSANGNIAITGTVGNSVGPGIKYRSTGGQLYTTTGTGTVTAFSQSIASITRSGSTATVVFDDDHELANGFDLTISSAVESDYNGTFPVTVTGGKTVTYAVSGAPTTPATGTILGAYDSALVSIASDEGGQNQNLSSGADLTVTIPIAGIDDGVTVAAVSISGGTDIESNSDFRSRIGEAFRGIPANFNVDQITIEARKVSGVTRVFVEKATPIPGQVTVYFLRDNDSNIIPDASEVSDVFDAIFAIAPASMLAEDVIVAAPTPVTVNFTMGSINPNTESMEAAITDRLTQMFREGVTVGADLKEDAYRGAIFGTVDTTTGQLLIDFNIQTPSGDIPIASGEIPVLGTVVFA